jgi:hypothetical protein
MENQESPPICCIQACPATATSVELGETANWLVFLPYCDEHAREIEKGTPVGPVGIDSSRVQIVPRGRSEPNTAGSLHAIGPH